MREPEEDLSNIYFVDIDTCSIEIGWNAVYDTFYAEIYNPGENSEISNPITVVGVEPGSYHRLDYLISELNRVLQKTGSTETVSIPRRILDYMELGVPPQSLIGKLNDIILNK